MSANKHSHGVCQEIALSNYGETIYMTFTEQRNILRNILHKIDNWRAPCKNIIIAITLFLAPFEILAYLTVIYFLYNMVAIFDILMVGNFWIYSI